VVLGETPNPEIMAKGKKKKRRKSEKRDGEI
jgi:hypothetical protein